MSEHTNIRAFADDLVVYEEMDDIKTLENRLNVTLKKMYNTCMAFNLYMSKSKCKVMHVTNKKNDYKPNIYLGNNKLEIVKEYKYLGFIFDNRLKFDNQINQSIKKAKNRMNLIKYISNGLRGSKIGHLINMYKTFVRPVIEYGFSIYLTVTKSRLKKLESFQHICLTSILKINIRSSYISLICTLNLLSMEQRYILLSVNFIKKSVKHDINNMSKSEITKFYNKKTLFYSKKCIYEKLCEIYNKFVEKNNKSKNDIKKQLVLSTFNNLLQKSTRNKNMEFFVKCYKTMIKQKTDSLKKYLTLDNKTLHFYIKIMTGSLNLNYFLNKIKVKNSSICKTCSADETIVHRLFYCKQYSKQRKKFTNFKKIKNKTQQINFITDINKLVCLHLSMIKN